MYCIVYPLRRDGKKLPPEEVQAGALVGWLVVDRFMWAPVLQARLWHERPDNHKTSPKYFAQIEHVELKTVQGGILLQGSESTSQGVAQRQAWWIVPEHSRPPPPAPHDPHKTITEYQPPIMGLGSFGEG